jgi:predicted nucleotidyltransferase
MGDGERVRELAESLGARPEVRVAYLFGSRARGSAAGSSDWDVAVLLDEGAIERPWPGVELELLDLLTARLHAPVDLVLLNRAPPVLGREVLRDATVLVERDREERLRFEAGVVRRYLDTRPLRAVRDAAVARRLGLEERR